MGDAEALPFADDSFDRYVSCGSIEYWPDPARAIAEAHRVVRPGGTILVVGPAAAAAAVSRRLVADAWMLFPTETQYRGWFEAAGIEEIEELRLGAAVGAQTPARPATRSRSPAAPARLDRPPRPRAL